MKVNHFIATIVLLLVYYTSSAQTFRSVNNPPNHLWNDASSWDLGSVPTSGDTVLILNNDTIVVNTNTNVDKVTLRGNGQLQVNSGSTLTVLQNVAVQAQNHNGNTTSLIVNGTLSVGNNLAITSRKKINYTAIISGSGTISTVNNFTLNGDTTSATATISTPINVGNNCTVTAKNASGELTTNLNSTLNITGNLTLRTQNGADSTNNLFDMRFSGSSISIGNNLNFSGGGGFLQNSAAVSSSVSFTTFSKLRVSDQVEYHDVHITTSGNASDKEFSNILGDFIIDNGCILTTNKRTAVISSGNLVVNGSIASSSGDDSLIFNGTSAQTISGSGNATLENLIIRNSSGVTNSMNINIIKVLSIESGTFSTGGSVTLKSTSSRTAIISEIGNNGAGAGISGSVTCERNINGATTAGYRHLSSPVQGTQLSDFQDGTSPEGIYTYGFTGSNAPSAGGYNSCYQYDPAIANGSGNADDGWVAATNSSNGVTPHEAWTIYVGGTTGPGAKSSYDLSTSGSVYSGSVTLNSSNANIAANSGGTQEWGLVGNPYPCTIQWDAVSKSNINSIAQIYAEDDFNGYRTTNFNAGANRVPPFQAFWVQTSGASPSITFEENDKITNNVNYRKNSLYENRMYVEIRDSARNYHVGACLEFNSIATPHFEPQLDGIIFENPWPYPNLYFPIEDSLHGQVYSTYSDQVQIIPLKIYAAKSKSGSYSLEFNQLPKLKACIQLEDRKKGVFITIDSAFSYSFHLGEDASENRFYIHYYPGATNYSGSHLSCYQSGDGSISFNSPSGVYTPTLYDIDLNRIQLVNKNGNLWKANSLQAKQYVLTLIGSDNCKSLSYPATILEPTEVISKFNTSSQYYKVNEEISFSNVSQGASQFEWLFDDGSSGYLFEPQKKFDKTGVYDVMLIASNGNSVCNDSSSSAIYISDYLGTMSSTIENTPFKLTSTTNGYYLISNFDQPIFGSVTIYASNGSVVSQSKESFDKSQTKLVLPPESGIYIIKVLTNGSEQWFKIVKN